MLSEDKTRIVGGTLIGFNETQASHVNNVHPDHPESSNRIIEAKKMLEDTGLLDQCEVINKFLDIDDEDLQLTHQKTMVEEMRKTADLSQELINETCNKYDSVFMTNKSFDAAKEAVSCSRDLANKIMNNEARNGFAIVRPPGHHADPESPCGFCIFNNVAQAAEEAFFAGADRILIVDLDLHHGQGTQRKFYDDKRVLYFSIHRYEHGLFWPHLPESDFDHIGEGPGTGFNANLPLNETGCGDADYMCILFNVLLPLATQFDPHFVIISAGFDCLKGDPIGGMSLSPDAYSHIVYHLKSLAQGKMLLVLEGGYNHKMIGVAVHRCVRVLLGHSPYSFEYDSPPKESTITSCISLIATLRNYWTCFDYFPSNATMRLAEWPIINPKVIFKYKEEDRPPNTENIEQSALYCEKWSKREYDCSSITETRIYFNEGDDRHFDKSDSDHPENPNRTLRILEKLRNENLMERCVERKCDRAATDDELRMVHNSEMIDYLNRTTQMTDDELSEEGENLDSIFLTRDTLQIAKNAVGTVLQAVDEVFEVGAGERNGFVVVRPPGHHSSNEKPSGFCIFNNVAIAARYAQRKFDAKKVLIFDWDVHHGNGTQQIFYEDETVLYMSIHRHDRGGFYPMGEPKDYFDIGEGKGKGFSVNVPFSGTSMGNFEYFAAFCHSILPIAYPFNPDLVLISSGFDAAINDPLGAYKLTPEAFALMTYQLSALANGRIIGVLEGGYNLNSISSCSLAVCEVLLHRSMVRRIHEEKEQYASEKPKLNSQCIRSLREVCDTQRQYWNQLEGLQVRPFDIGLEFESEDEDEMSDDQSTGGESSSSTRPPQAPFDLGGVHAVVPLTTCPHLEQVTPLPNTGIDASTKCTECNVGAEVWTCLTCYASACGRFVNEHALMHHLSTSHPMALSLADLSVWCYPCESYVHNEILIPAKSSAHQSKFGEQIPS